MPFWQGKFSVDKPLWLWYIGCVNVREVAMKDLIFFILDVATLATTLIFLRHVYSVEYGGIILVCLTVFVWRVTSILRKKK